jgi:hypothetical protein
MISTYSIISKKNTISKYMSLNNLTKIQFKKPHRQILPLHKNNPQMAESKKEIISKTI